MTLALIDIYGEVRRHLDAWDMADGMVRQIAWTPRWIPEMQREAMLIDRLFYPEKWIFQRHQLSRRRPPPGRHRQHGQLRRRDVHRARSAS